MRAAVPETKQQKLSDVYVRPVKAVLDPKVSESPLRTLVKEAIPRGQQASAAIEIGIGDARLSAKLTDGTIQIRELEKLAPSVWVKFAEQIIEQYGALASPEARTIQQIDLAIAVLHEVRQYVVYKEKP